MRGRRWRLVWGAGLLPLVLAGAWLGVSAATGPWYRSEVTLILSYQPSHSEGSIGFTGMTERDVMELESFRSLQMSWLTSHEVLNGALRWPGVMNTEWRRSFSDDNLAAIEALRRHLRIEPIDGSTLVEVSLALPSPHDAQVVLDAIITSYLQESIIEFRMNPPYGIMLTRIQYGRIEGLRNSLEQVIAKRPSQDGINEAQAEWLGRVEEVLAEISRATAVVQELRRIEEAGRNRVKRAGPPTQGERVWFYWPW